MPVDNRSIGAPTHLLAGLRLLRQGRASRTLYILLNCCIDPLSNTSKNIFVPYSGFSIVRNVLTANHRVIVE